MAISLKSVTLEEAEAFHQLQRECFLPLYKHYGDADNPAKESLESIKTKISSKD